MSLHRRLLASALGLLACAAVACSSVAVHLSERATGSYDPQSGREISMRGCGLQLFNLIPISTNNRQRRAYEALVKQAPNAVVTDVKVSERWYWVYIGNVYCTHLTATAYSRQP